MSTTNNSDLECNEIFNDINDSIDDSILLNGKTVLVISNNRITNEFYVNTSIEKINIPKTTVILDNSNFYKQTIFDKINSQF